MDGIYVYHYHNVSINKVFRILSTDKNPPYIFFSVYKKILSGSPLPVPNQKKKNLSP